jgi:hypothetical protein
MPVRKDQHVGRVMSRVRDQNERRALRQAKRVPWKTMAATAELYTEWDVFTLWARAVVNAARGLPAHVRQELESRSPLLLEYICPVAEGAAHDAGDLGSRVWQAVGKWAESNVFLEPRRAGWLDAVRYFSSVSLESMKAWSCWERIEQEWCSAPPHEFPDYKEWQQAVSAVGRLSDGSTTAQQVLDTVRVLPELEWRQHLSDFSDLIAFSLWMEVVLDVDGSSRLVAEELAQRYRGFDLASAAADSRETVRALNAWVVEHHLAGPNQERLLAALTFQVTHHPAYHAMRNYAQHCHSAWQKERPDHLPTFEEWRPAADEYFEM